MTGFTLPWQAGRQQLSTVPYIIMAKKASRRSAAAQSKSSRSAKGHGASAKGNAPQGKSPKEKSRQGKPARGRSGQKVELPPAALMRPAGAAFAALALLRLVAGQFPDLRLWGLSYPGYLPVWGELLIAALGVALATPLFYGIYRWKAQLLERLPALPLSLLAAVAGGIVFWVFRMDTFFLGDGASYLAEHFRWVRGAPVSDDVLFSPGSAPLTAWLLATLAKMLYGGGEGLTAAPQFIFQAAAVVSGAVFLFIVLYSSLRRTEDAALRLVRIALLIATPGLLFFFGYVEYYTLYFTALTSYFIASAAVAQGKLSPAWMVLAFVVSAALHLMTLVTLPGMLIALAARGGESARRLVTLRTLLIGTAVVLVIGGIYYFASGVAFEGSRVILALQPFGEEGAVQHYTLLSGAHLGDILNMILLAAAPPLLLLAFVPWRGHEWSSAELVTLSHVLYTGFLLLFGYTCFGMARDWDVNAGFGVAVSLFAVTMLAGRTGEPRRSWLGYLAIGAAAVAVVPWLLVNIDTDMSERRFRDIMALDDELLTGDFALNGYEHLRKHYQRTGQPEEEAWAIRKKVEMVGYPADFRKLLRAVMLQVPPENQKGYMDFVFTDLAEKLRRMEAQDLGKIYPGTRREFVEVTAEALLQIPQLQGLQDAGNAYFEKQYRMLSNILPDHPLLEMAALEYRHDRGAVLSEPAPFIEAMPLIENSSLLASRAGRALILTGRPEEATTMLNRAMEIDSAFTLPHFLLGYIAATAEPPRPSEAIRHLETFIATPEGHQLADPAAQERYIRQAREMIGRMTMRSMGIDPDAQ